MSDLGAQPFGQGGFGGTSFGCAPGGGSGGSTMGASALGGFAYGGRPYGGGSFADVGFPVVIILSPQGDVTTGPLFQVSWTYVQATGLPQVEATVTIAATGGATLVTVPVSGATTSVTVNAINAGLQTQSTGGAYTVTVTASAATGLTTTATETFDMDLGVSDLQITSPAANAAVSGTFPVTWVLTDVNPQVSYEVSIEDSSGVEQATTGIVQSAAAIATLGWLPGDTDTYQLIVTVTDSNGVISSDFIAVTGALSLPGGASADTQPALSNTTMRLYNRLPQVFLDYDTQQDPRSNPPTPLLSYISLIGEQMGLAEDLYDRFLYIPADQGGPAQNSGLPHSTSDLVNPYTADEAWLPWLGMLYGTPQRNLTVPQWRFAMGDVLASLTAGSLQGVINAVQQLNAQLVGGVVTISGYPIVNAPGQYGTAIIPTYNSDVVSLEGGTWLAGNNAAVVAPDPFTVVLTVTETGSEADFEFLETAPVTAPPATYTVAGHVQAGVNSQLVTVTVAASNGTNTVTSQVSLTDPVGAPVAFEAQMAVPDDGTTYQFIATPQVTVTGALQAGETHTVTGFGIYNPLCTPSMVGAIVIGDGVSPGTVVTAVVGPTSFVVNPAPITSTTLNETLIVPPVPVVVNDHYNGDPWTVGLGVPYGTDTAALALVLEAQKPAGVLFDIYEGVLTWTSLFDNFHDTTESAPYTYTNWDAITGKSWTQLEQGSA